MSKNSAADAVVAGHVCLDIIPELPNLAGSPIPDPGKLRLVGAALISTGGVVTNTGIALHRLGIRTRLMGKIGRDTFGQGILDIVRREDARLAEGMIVDEDVSSAYTLVFSPPGADRCFLHCPGANDSFGADDIDYESIRDSKLFHFGYPPVMQRMYVKDGAELASMLRRVKSVGLTTSIDMVELDPNTPAGKANWRAILKTCLPFVDIFLPSIDEILYMLDQASYIRFKESGEKLDPTLLDEIAAECIALGAAVVCLKLGDKGIYLRSSADADRLAAMGKAAPPAPEAWTNRELLAPCFDVVLVGATGSGDCTIAGFLAAMLLGMSPEESLVRAVAVGACNVETPDATSGIRSWEATEARIDSGWKRHRLEDLPKTWRWDEGAGVYRGPGDARAKREA